MQKDLFEQINRERYLQDQKWGEQNHNNEKWLMILIEEIGEVVKNILEDIKYEQINKELVQVAAVVVA